MQKDKSGTYWYAPTDLVRFLESPYASFMARRFLEDPTSLTPDAVDPILGVLGEMGEQHELTEVTRLSDADVDIQQISRGIDAEQETRAALDARRAVIYQARLVSAPFRGYADFLEWSEEDDEYIVWDAKLSSSVKPYYLVQLCCYAEMLEAATGTRPTFIGVLLGNGERRRFRTDDFFYYYAAVRDAFLAQMAAFDSTRAPEPNPRADHGRWNSHAKAYLEGIDHLVQVAGISKGQMRRLQSVGIDTLTALSETDIAHVPKLAPSSFARLREQAALQKQSAGAQRPTYRVLPPPDDGSRQGLMTLPPPSPKDVFFDMEGDPLVDGGLEYLFGATHLEDGEPKFFDAWAYEKAEEQQAFEAFVDWVMARWRADPTMHIYHYAPYEVSALSRLMGTYATREDEIDHFLRHDVFVDLYRVTRHGVRIGTPSYSLKDVEKLYRERTGDVSNAAESIVEFERFLRSGEPPDWRASPILKSIRDYNQVDCDSTWQLAEWLRERQHEAGIAWKPPQASEKKDDKDPSEHVVRRMALVKSLVADSQAQDEPTARTSTLLAQLLEFHRREDKPVWWSFFARHDMTPDERYDDATCIGKATLESGPIPIKQSKGYWYRFDANQDTKIDVDASVHIGGNLIASLKVADMEAGRLLVKVGPKVQKNLDDGKMPEQACFLRHSTVGPGTILTSIEAVADTWCNDQELPLPLRNLMVGTAPPIHGHRPGDPIVAPDVPPEDVLRDTSRAVQNMQGGTLCIQGPPGSGKTFTASHVIRDLLDDGKNVGVTSNSHEAILNVMRAVNELYEDGVACIKVGDEDHPLFAEYPCIQHIKQSAAAEKRYGGGLIGGTAWLFSRDGMRNRLDYLFVDEAGQVSLANLVGMSRAATNIVLLGDQMQLAQPLQGTHPGDSGHSALEFALQGHQTVPSSLGIFLPTSYRMHPDICALISGAFYEDRLSARPENAARVVQLPEGDPGTVPIEAGILFVPVAHEGNEQASLEEAEHIRALAKDLRGRAVTNLEGTIDSDVGPLRNESSLFVAPFNMQARLLRETIPGARSASVDKFQGQEAPVAVVSLCRSADASDSGGRGLDFVLDPNRLNVAVSRGICLAIVVGDPGLVLASATSVDAVKRQNLLARIIAHSQQKTTA